MTNEYQPRRRGQTIHRRIARNLLTPTLICAGSLGISAIGTKYYYDYIPAVIPMVFGKALAIYCVLFMAIQTWAAWKNPKGFAKKPTPKLQQHQPGRP